MLAGRVSVNGTVVRTLGAQADPARDVIAVDGERLATQRPHKRTVMLHKPRGVVSTLADPEGRATVRDLLGAVGERLYPVGRLDLQSSGLLLLTNDGELAQGLLHPGRAVERVYHAKVDGQPTGRLLARLRRGVRLDDGLVTPTRVRLVSTRPTKAWLEIGVAEGRKHVVRRLLQAVGHPVDKLVRVQLGPVGLGTLPLAAWRDCTSAEVDALRVAAGLAGVSRRAAGAGAAPRRRGRGTPPKTPPPRTGSRARSGPRAEQARTPAATRPRTGRGARRPRS